MNAQTRQQVQENITKAYQEGQNEYAYYLELCLKTNEAPR